jgi:hypothetical protein
MEEVKWWQEKRREQEELWQEAMQYCVDGYMFFFGVVAYLDVLFSSGIAEYI